MSRQPIRATVKGALERAERAPPGSFSFENRSVLLKKSSEINDMTTDRIVSLELEELEERIAPGIVLTNPGGNHPQGNGADNGTANDYENPAGSAPPGQNK